MLYRHCYIPTTDYTVLSKPFQRIEKPKLFADDIVMVLQPSLAVL